MSHEYEPDDEDLLRHLSALPRTAPVAPGDADRMVARLKQEGVLRAHTRVSSWMRRAATAAAAAVIFAIGMYAGNAYTRHNSLEESLRRTDLTLSDRVLLLQRAGAAYVQAAQSYADATKNV